MAEIIRSGIQAVDKGQSEAARSIGMNSVQTMLYIVLPQEIKNSFPAIGNEFVINIKDSSVLNAVSYTHLDVYKRQTEAKAISGIEAIIHIKMFLINVLQWLVKHIQNLVHMIV